jgi:hypothetical protein
MGTNTTGENRQTAMTEHLTSISQTTRSQAKVTDSDTTDLEKRAISKKLMDKDDNYFTTFPTQMIRIVAEMNMTPTPGLAARKKAWEDIEIMAKLMKAKVWTSREKGLQEELVSAVMKAVDEKL